MREILYYLSFVVGFAVSVIINRRLCVKFGYKAETSVLYSVCTFISGIIGAMLMAVIKDALLSSLSVGYDKHSTVCIFGSLVFAPFIMCAVFKITGAKILKGLDFISSEVYLILAFSKIGCTCSGCCYGIEFEHGIYNAGAGCNVFPVQICESAVTFVIFFILLYKAEKGKNKFDGCMFASGLMLYTFCRFFFEYLRFYAENDIEGNLLSGLSLWQVMSVICFVSGFLMYVLSRKTHRKKINSVF